MTDHERSGFSRLVGRIGSHSALYVASAAIVALLGLATVVVVTRYLEPGDFGDLSVLTVSASLLTLAYNAGSLQGTFSWVFGTTGDDEAPADAPGATASDPRRALATGFAMTGGIAAAGTLAVIAAAAPLSEALLEHSDDRRLVVWTAIAAGAASVWRLAANCVRLQRRPFAYLVASAAHGLFGLAATTVLLERGYGLEGAVGGLAIGSVAAAALTMAQIRRELAWRVSRSDAAAIVRRGRALVLVVASFSTLQLADVLLLSRFVPAADVGVYRVAARLGGLVAYWTSSFHMAWGALRRDPLHLAADDQEGAGEVASRLTTYFIAITAGVVLAAAVFSDQLVRVAGPGYEAAAEFIPLTAVAFALHGVYVLVYRTAEFPGKREWFVRLSVAAAVVFLALGVLLIPRVGISGAPIAVSLGWTTGIVGMWWLGQSHGDRVPYRYGRIAAATVAAGAFYLVHVTLGSSFAAPLACVTGYAALVVATGIVPRQDVRAIARAAISRGPRSEPLGARVAALAPEERRLCELLLTEGRGVGAVSALVGMDRASLLTGFVAALRKLEGLGPPRASDEAVGDYLLLDATFAQRERRAARLYRDAVDPLELERLSHSVRRLRGVPAETWESRSSA